LRRYDSSGTIPEAKRVREKGIVIHSPASRCFDLSAQAMVVVRMRNPKAVLPGGNEEEAAEQINAEE